MIIKFPDKQIKITNEYHITITEYDNNFTGVKLHNTEEIDNKFISALINSFRHASQYVRGDREEDKVVAMYILRQGGVVTSLMYDIETEEQVNWIKRLVISAIDEDLKEYENK